MAMIQAGDIVTTNPYLLDSFTVERYLERINEYGESRPEVFFITGVSGIVYPEGPNELRRRPEADVTEKTIVIITDFLLRGESDCEGKAFKPDTVKWKSNHFLVVKVEDWSDYSQGFVKCTCTSRDVVDRPPTAFSIDYDSYQSCSGGAMAFPQPVVFNAVVGQTVFRLPGTPIGAVLWFWNGELQSQPDDYVLEGSVITVTEAPPAGTTNRYVAFYAMQPGGDSCCS